MPRQKPKPKPKPSEPDEPVFFRATPPPPASPETHHLAPNPELDRSDSNRREGIDTGQSFFTEAITGVREGYENAMRVLVMSNNALFETDVERRFAAIKEALTRESGKVGITDAIRRTTYSHARKHFSDPSKDRS